MTEDRQLAAIMFTDIVGYTHLMGEDESKALQALEQQNLLIKPLLTKNKGEMLKEIGDGTLSRFRSAVDAVGCAIEIQKEFSKKVEFRIRIGIHVGDVVIRGGDIFGDGVNVASRIESLAEPGGICISASVYEYIRNQIDVQTVFLGEKQLKNVAEPVTVYALAGEGLSTPKAAPQKISQPSRQGYRNIVLMLLIVSGSLYAILNFFYNPVENKPPEIAEVDQESPLIDNENKIVLKPVTEEIRKKYSEEIALLENDLATLKTKIAELKNDNTAKLAEKDGLESVLKMIDIKEQKEKRLEEVRVMWKQAIEYDFAVYNKIVASPSGQDLKEAAWQKLVAKYPEASGLGTGELDLLRMLLFKEWIEPTTGIEFILIKGGCFQMGDKFGTGDEDEKPVHEVCVDSFGIGKYEITQGQWQKIMGSNPSKFTIGDNYPVEQVSWFSVQDFIRNLTSQNNKSFRLPTEAEWEFAACSGGNNEQYAGGNDIDKLAWYRGNSEGSTHPVGLKEPNNLGIHDMSGNVWEWCSDWYSKDYYQNSLRDNPPGPSSGSFRVIRDGCWNGSPWLSRCSNRDGFEPGNRLDNLGFRLVFPVNLHNRTL